MKPGQVNLHIRVGWVRVLQILSNIVTVSLESINPFNAIVYVAMYVASPTFTAVWY